MEEQNPKLIKYMESADPDATLMNQIVDALCQHPPVPEQSLSPGNKLPLNVFFCGYAGAGNTGADVRVYEIMRQFRHLWGENVAFCLSVMDAKLCSFFKGMTDIRELVYLPEFVPAMTNWADIAVACEGSLFKSNFGDVLSLSMLSTIAFAKSAGKLALAYGSEAGSMSHELLAFTGKFCKGTSVFCRNKQSVERLSGIGLNVLPGVDTAWSFDPGNSDWARKQLKQSGWDGQQPLLTICPVNPYWWPVRADPERYRAFLQDGSHAENHYGFFYFHAESEEISRKFEAYIQSICQAVESWGRQKNAHVVLIGMDRIDQAAVKALSAQLTCPHSVFTSPEFSPGQIVSLLRLSDVLISSRFHAIVCSMPAGVPCIGLAYDERVPNVIADSGYPELAISVKQGVTQEAISGALEAAWNCRREVTENLQVVTAQQLIDLGRMGRSLCALIQKRYPHLPCNVDSADPVDYLPPLSPELQRLLDKYGYSNSKL